jgi:2-polyprenyl-3-methyl-5-hydroxy-6-metoxy-1,4-benzoquinol methylase
LNRFLEEPELLDELPADDPRAIHSRHDLIRVNKLMGNADIMSRALMTRGSAGFFDRSASSKPGLSIVELGGGDGTFLFSLAQRVAPTLGAARCVLVDQQRIVSSATAHALAGLGWNLDVVQADVFDYLQAGDTRADLVIANLFLHHFDDRRLRAMLEKVSRRTRLFLTCEPHRSRMAFAAASLMGLIGCNHVSVHDGRISVRAGFRDTDLSRLWPADGSWSLEETKAGRFTHTFVAQHA